MPRYGLAADTPDIRDLLLDDQPRPTDSVDLRLTMPAVYNQGAANSCVGNGVASVMEHAWIMGKQTDFAPSRLFIYFNARMLEGDPGYDAGCQIRDGLKSVAQFGACHEGVWPYDPKKVTIKPGGDCYADALSHKALVYYRVQRDLDQIRGCLTAGFPVVFGMACYESFESRETAESGIVSMPSLSENVMGAHCMVIVGFDNRQQMFLVRNSWGAAWGVSGHCWIPYIYMANRNLTADFWTIRRAA
jgi:C1A family cysteine protease